MKKIKKMFELAGFICGILFSIGIFFMAPIFTMAALNAIFNMGIQYTFINWFAVLWLHVILAVRKNIK